MQNGLFTMGHMTTVHTGPVIYCKSVSNEIPNVSSPPSAGIV